MFVTTLLGIAKPMPAAAPPSWGSAAARVGMPITWPSMLTRAPPELPGLIAALVWIALGRTTPLPSGSWRSRALTMPSVKLELSPSGLPIAMAMSPIRSRVRVGELRRAQTGAVDLDHGEVVGREGPDERALQLRARRGRDGEGLRAADDVVVRDDVALRVEDDAGAEPLARLDLDDRRGDLGVDAMRRRSGGRRRPRASRCSPVLLEAKPAPTATMAEATRIVIGSLSLFM